MIPIENKDARPDWNAIKAEYIAGASYGALASRYGLSKSTVFKKSKKEQWDKQRERTANAVETRTINRTADKIADNAVVAQRIRAKLLRVLEREVDALPESIGTEMHQDVANLSYEKDKNGNPIKNGKLTKRTDGGKRYKLTDLTKAYRDLTEDLPMGDSDDIEDLNPLVEMLK